MSPLHKDPIRPSERVHSRHYSSGQTPAAILGLSPPQFQPGETSDACIPAPITACPICVIIPAFNEEAGIAYVIEQVKQVARQSNLLLEIVVVDDGSTDGTAAIARRAGARVVHHRNRRGYGAALNTGLIEAASNIIVVTDADGTYPVRLLPKLISALNHSEMAVASRPRFRGNPTPLRSVIKLPLTLLSNYIAGARIPDLNSGMRAFHREAVLPYLGILPNAFSWTTTVTLCLLCERRSVAYIPVTYKDRLGPSKFKIRHAAIIPLLLLRVAFLFAPFKVFAPLAAISFACGATQCAFNVMAGKAVSPGALCAFLLSGLFGMLAAAGDVNPGLISSISRRIYTSNSPASSCGSKDTALNVHTSQTPSKLTQVGTPR